ncbi:hypothetical protein [Methanococcus sp. CF]
MDILNWLFIIAMSIILAVLTLYAVSIGIGKYFKKRNENKDTIVQ